MKCDRQCVFIWQRLQDSFALDKELVSQRVVAIPCELQQGGLGMKDSTIYFQGLELVDRRENE